VKKISASTRRKKGKKARPFFLGEREDDFIFFRFVVWSFRLLSTTWWGKGFGDDEEMMMMMMRVFARKKGVVAR
jgi:hypothetical protein